MVLGIFKIAVCLRDYHVFIWQSVEILNRLSGKQKPFSKLWSTAFKLKALRSKTHHFHTKLPYQKPMLRQIEWWVHNGPIKKNEVLLVTISFFKKLCFSLRTSYRHVIWCANYLTVHICTFCKHWSFIWRFFFPVSILI